MPIKPYAEFRAFLEENIYKNKSTIYKTNYIGGTTEFDNKKWARVAHYNVGVKHWRDKNPLYREFWKKTNRLLYYLQGRVGINRLRTQKMQLAFGSPWWSISDEFANYVIDHENLLRRYYIKNGHLVLMNLVSRLYSITRNFVHQYIGLRRVDPLI